MSSSYWNCEDDENIICPYCGEEYEPSYEDTYIGDESVDCYAEDTNTYTCDRCGKEKSEEEINYTLSGKQLCNACESEGRNGS